VAGLTLSGAATLSHDLWVNVVRKGEAPHEEQLKVARIASVLLGVLAIALGLSFKGQNVAFMVGLAFALAASGNFPALVLSIYWPRFTTAGAVAAIVSGTLTAAVLIFFSPTVQIDILHHGHAWFPLKNPAIVSMPLAFAVAIFVSLVAPEAAASAGYAAKERRMILGES
jgi:cation/acetate symporter